MRIFAAFIFIASFIIAQDQNLNNKFMLGQNFEQSGDYKKAKELYESVYNSSPQNFQYFDALNRVYIQLKEYENSVQLLEKRIKQNPLDLNLYSLLGKTFYLMGDEKKAFAVWDDALAKQPDNPMHYRIIANAAIERRAFEKAIDYLKLGQKKSDDPKIFSYDLGNLYSLTMRFKEAAEEYCFIITQEPNQLRGVESRILSYISKPDALQKTIEAFENCSKNNAAAEMMLARLYMEIKSFNKALDLYLSIDKKQNSQGTELFNFGQILYKEGEYSTASKVFSVIIDKYPESPIASSSRLGFAKTGEFAARDELKAQNDNWKPFKSSKEISSSKLDEVIKAYSSLADTYPNSEIANESYLRIAKIYFELKKDGKKAKEFYHQIISDSPLSQFAPEAYKGLSFLELKENNITKAEEYLQKTISSPRSTEEDKNIARYRLSRINFYQGDFVKAKENLGGILTNLKDNTANDALELSLLLNTTLNDSASLLTFAEGELLAEQEKFDLAAVKFESIADNPKLLLLSSLSKLRKAEMYLALNNLETSVIQLNSIADEEIKNIFADKALFLLGQIYLYGLNEPIKAVEAFERLLAKFPGSLYLDEAREYIFKIKQELKQS